MLSFALVATIAAAPGWKGLVVARGEPAQAQITIYKRSPLPAGEAKCFTGNWRFYELALRDPNCTDARSMAELLKRARAFKEPKPLATLRTDEGGFFETTLPPGVYDLLVDSTSGLVFQRVNAKSDVALRLEVEPARLGDPMSTLNAGVFARHLAPKRRWLIGLDVPFVFALAPNEPIPTKVPLADWLLLDETATERIPLTRDWRAGGVRERGVKQVSGLVTRDGKPVPRAMVALSAGTLGETVASRRANQAGAFTLPLVPSISDLDEISVSAGLGDGCAWLKTELPKSPSNIEIQLQACGPTVVVKGGGTPISGATLELWTERASSRRSISLADGRVVLPPLQDFEKVVVTAPGFGRWESRTMPSAGVALAPLRRHTVEFETNDGRLFEPNFCHGSLQPRPSPQPGKAIFDIDEAIPTARCRPEGDWPAFDVSFAEADMTVRIPPMASVLLTEGLSAEPFTDSSMPKSDSVLRARVGPMGIRYCKRGNERVWGDNSCSFAVVDLREGFNSVTLPLAPQVKWKVKVESSEGNPLTKTPISLTGGTAGETHAATSDAQGIATVSSTPGWYVVSGKTFSNWCHTARPCVVSEREQRAQVPVLLALAGAGAKVKVVDGRGLEIRYEAGRAELLAPGKHAWLIDSSHLIRFEAIAGKPVNLTHTLSPLATIVVTVKNTNGEPIANARVLAGLSQGWGRLFDESQAATSMRTDAAGVARFDGLRAGNVPIRVLAHGYAPGLFDAATAVDATLGASRKVAVRAAAPGVGYADVELTMPYRSPFETIGLPEVKVDFGETVTVDAPTTDLAVWAALRPDRYPGAAWMLVRKPGSADAITVEVPTGTTQLVFPSLGAMASPLIYVGKSWTKKTVSRRDEDYVVCTPQMGNTCITSPLPKGPATVVMWAHDDSRRFVQGPNTALTWQIEIQESGIQVVIPPEAAETGVE